MEAVIRRLVHAAPEVSHFVLDFGRVTNVDPPSARLLQALEEALAQQGRAVAFSGISRHPRVLRLLDEARARHGRPAPHVFDELEVAVEWCENALLAAHGAAVERHEELPLSKHELLRGLGADELEWVAKLMERRSYAAREIVVRKDDAADELFLLVDGALSVLSDLSDGRLRRLATLSPGMGFGEPSMLEGATRTAFVRADRPSVCWVLKRATFASLDASCPALKIRLLENFLRSTTKALGRLSLESLAERV
jgi:glutaminase